MTTPLVTVFGGSGFIGRHLVRRLAKQGARVRVAVRDVEAAKFLKPFGHIGQIVPVKASVTDADSVARAVEGADAAVNLVGILYEKGKRSFHAVHKEGAANVAQAAKAAGVRRLVHMSALGADMNAAAKYARTKALGERDVLDAFPDAVVVRPSVVFGPEDDFFNRFAAMVRVSPVLPVIVEDGFTSHKGEDGAMVYDWFGSGGARFQPVYVGDVAEVLCRGALESGFGGKIYELGGARAVTMLEVMELVRTYTRRDLPLVPVPLQAMAAAAYLTELLPVPPLTRDQIKLMQTPNVLSGTLPGLEAFGLAPTPLEAVLPTYLNRFAVRDKHVILRDGVLPE